MHMHACRQVEHAPLEIAPSWKLPPKQPQRKPADRPHVSTSPLQRRVHTQRELGTLTRVCRNLAPRDGLVSALPLLTTVYSELLAAGTPARLCTCPPMSYKRSGASVLSVKPRRLHASAGVHARLRLLQIVTTLWLSMDVSCSFACVT